MSRWGKISSIWARLALASIRRPPIKSLWLAPPEKAGLDPNRLLEAIGAGAAGSWQLTNMAPRVLKGDLAPGFFVKHFIKDMKIVQQESRQRGVELEMLDAVLKMYEQMSEMGLDDRGTQALIQYYRK